MGAHIVHHQHRKALGLQRLGDGPHPDLATQQQYAFGVGLGQAQMGGDLAGREAVDRHGADDDEEGGGYQRVRTFVADFLQAQGEDRRYRRGDDAARRHPAQEQLLVVSQRGAPGGGKDRGRSHDEQQHRQKDDAAQADAGQVGRPQVGGQQDEDRRDQHHPQAFLEFDDMLDRDLLLVGQRKAHQRHAQQPRLVLQQIGAGERGDHQHDGDRVLQVVRRPVAFEHLYQRPGTRQAHGAADEDGLEHHRRGDAAHIAVGGQDDLIHQHRRGSADGVDDDAFPLEDGTGLPGGPDMPQHRHDHGGPGHHQHGAQQYRQAPVQPQQQVREDCREHPGHAHADADQPRHGGADFLEFFQREREAALEQDDRHRQRDHRVQQVAQQRVRVQKTGDRAGDDAEHQQQQDRGDGKTPAYPLSGNTEHRNRGQADQQAFYHFRPRPARRYVRGIRPGCRPSAVPGFGCADARRRIR